MDLKNRTALITGAGRRIGRAIGMRLARAGCDVAIHYNRSADPAAAVAADCQKLGVRAVAMAADLEDPNACRTLIAQVRAQFGRLDVLVNNASLFGPMDIDHFTLQQWDRHLRVNVTAPMVLAHEARAALRTAKGRIINLCDAATSRPWPSHIAYVVSKGALETLTQVLARAFAPEVNVVGIAPGVAEWPDDYDVETRARLTARIPLGRAGTPEDIAAAVHFILSEGDYITGVIIPIDGGRRLV
jgi:pteridine reductase